MGNIYTNVNVSSRASSVANPDDVGRFITCVVDVGSRRPIRSFEFGRRSNRKRRVYETYHQVWMKKIHEFPSFMRKNIK